MDINNFGMLMLHFSFRNELLYILLNLDKSDLEDYIQHLASLINWNLILQQQKSLYYWYILVEKVHNKSEIIILVLIITSIE